MSIRDDRAHFEARKRQYAAARGAVRADDLIYAHWD